MLGKLGVFEPVVHATGAAILDVYELTVGYNGTTALDRVTFHLNVGERVAVVGPNGAGKSTLFKVIAGVLEPTSGDVRVAGCSPRGHICIAYVPQRNDVDWMFPVTVEDVVMMGRFGRLGLFRRPGRQDRAVVRECLGIVGLAELAKRQISELSGGQQQRMFIARALAQESTLMLMDEPLTGLDMPAQERILALLDVLRMQGVTVMVATHDLNQAADYFDRVMLLNHRLLGIGTSAEVFTTAHLRDAYGGQLRLVETGDGLLALNDTCCGHG
ncbi:MAG: metal ABC transporter ATP-binding protein [Anaerolineae bacterium]|nr:metal ABC transporter ATP-binding protein [Anaerolineae bacterium]